MDINVFKGKTCIITGATAGIGFAMARQLAETGAQLVLAARNPQRLQEVVKASIDLGANAFGIPTDVGNVDHCKNFIEKAVELLDEKSEAIRLERIGNLSKEVDKFSRNIALDL